MPLYTDPMAGINRMNNSIERARRLAEERGMQDANYADQERAQGLRMNDARFAEERRRFDLGREDQAARRSQFDGLMRMLFGGGEPQPMEQNALRMRARSPMPLYDAPQDDGIDRRGINNSLARFIRGGM